MTVILLRVLGIALTVLYIYRVTKRVRASIGGGRSGPRFENKGRSSRHSSHSNHRDPYQVLGLSPSASFEEIKDAYKKLLVEYHPDKVTHLGKELREVAQEKTREIIEAFEFLEKNHRR